MRGLRPLLALSIATFACTAPTASEPPTTPAPTSTSTTTSSTTTTLPPPASIVLDDVEAMALDDGVRLEVSDGSGTVLGWLDHSQSEIDVDSAVGELTFRYPADDVVWTQPLVYPVTTVRQPWRGREGCSVSLPDGASDPVALVWQSGGDTGQYLDQLESAGAAVNVVSPLWWRVADDGTVQNTSDAAFVDAVHERNVAIWPAVAGFNADTHHLILSNPKRRSALAAEISGRAQRIGADGVNIDLEGYRNEDAGNFLTFVEELTGLVHEWGGVVSHDVVPRSDTWDVTPDVLAFWSTAPLRTELSEVTDCTILMAYDEHNRYRPTGPVASSGWVEEVLIYELRHADPQELVLGMPFYGLLWDRAELDRPQAVRLDELEDLSDHGRASPDPERGLDRVTLPDGRFFWAETTAGLAHRLDLVEEYGLAGWAAWRFGFDHPGIWELFAPG